VDNWDIPPAAGSPGIKKARGFAETGKPSETHKRSTGEAHFFLRAPSESVTSFNNRVRRILAGEALNFSG